MENSFYSSVIQWGNRLLVRGVRNGTAYKKKALFEPTLYVRTTATEDVAAQSMFGDTLKPLHFNTIKEAKEFVDRYEGMEDTMPIFGNTGFNYVYIHEQWPDQIEFDQSALRIYTLDIETASEFGFPSKEDPVEEVLLITVQELTTKERWTFGTRPFDLKGAKHLKSKDKITYVLCKDEKDLMTKFLRFWSAEHPDIVTGWNTEGFDIPYIVARMTRVLDEESVKKLSPWGEVRVRMIKNKQYGTEELGFDLLGVAQLDYLNLFKKFGIVKTENNKLDTVAEEILKRSKLENPYDTYREFYTKDWQLFVEYNMIDVELVDELDDKLQLMNLALTMAYDAKCNLNDVFSPTKVWDCLIYNHLALKGIQVHQRKSRESRRIEGGFVRDVERPQKYKWVVSFDATSLYPSIFLQYNLSPEKIIEGFALDTTVHGLLEDQYDLGILKDKDYAMTANGYCYRRDAQGLFPEIIARLFDERVMYKKKMQAAIKSSDPAERKLISKYNNFQQARKIQLNSLFGAMANKHFRYFDIRVAEGITTTGQYIIQRITDDLNAYLNKVSGTSGYNYSFYSDTDSCYVTLDPLVQRFYKDLPTGKIVNILDKICKGQLNDVLEASCKKIADDMHGFTQAIFFKREAIAEDAIFLGGKNYALNLWDDEGERFAEPKLKVKGLEQVKGNTPAIVKPAHKQALRICLTGTQKQLHAFMEKYEREYMQYKIEQIARPTSINGVAKYGNRDTIYGKGAQTHIRAALLYNHYLKEKGLLKKYPLIQEGEKIRFVMLKEPNIIGQDTIGFIGRLPKELGLDTYVDYPTMWEKTVMNPVQRVAIACGWTAQPQATLEGLFDE